MYRNMDATNETDPLLPSFESESWRSRFRKRWMKIPSEITITGIILGLFLVVVTLLIVFENVENNKADAVTLDNKLLASAFKYNKKAQDMSWQNKKDRMKDKNNFKESKWDNANKGWKKFPDISGSLKTTESEVFYKKIDSLEMPEIPPAEEYGKEIDDSWEEYSDIPVEMTDPRVMKEFNKDISEIKDLLHSKLKWKEIDDGWKKLSEDGWSDRKIRAALFKAMKEKRKELMDANSLQTPEEFEQLWDNIIQNWKENIKNGRVDEEQTNLHKGINTEYKKDIDVLQSPKSSFKKFIKADEGWEKLSDIGWKNKEIEEAMIKAWEEHKNTSMSNNPILQSPMNLPAIWGKTKGFINSIFHKGMAEQKSQKEINDDWANKFNILQSSYKKLKKYEDYKKKHSKDDYKNKTIDENEGMNDEPLQSPLGFDEFLKDIIEKIIEKIKNNKGTNEQKLQMKTNDEFAEVFNLLKSPTSIEKLKKWEELRQKHSKNNEALQSPVKFEDFMEDIIEEIKNKKGMDEQKSQMEMNDELANIFSPLKSPTSIEKLKKWEELRKKHAKNGLDDQNSQMEINDDWANEFSLLKSPTSIKKLKKWEELRKKHAKNGMDDQNSQMEMNDDEANEFSLLKSPTSFNKLNKWEELRRKHAKKDENTSDRPDMETNILKSPLNFEDFMEEIIENIKERKEKRNSFYGKNDGDVTSRPRDDTRTLQSSMPFEDVDWKKMSDEWKKITGQSGKDKEIKDAVDKARKDGHKLLQSAVGHDNMKWKKVNDGWKKISNKSITLPTKCPFSKFHKEHLLGSAMSAPSINCALITEEVRRKYGRCIDLSFLPTECKPSWRQKCFTTYKYRKIDGTCNNKIHPTWGKSGTPFVRMLAPDYADGVSSLRTAQDGGPLPNPRLLSRKLYSKQMKPDSKTSVLFLYFGLLVDHDMVETAVDSDSIHCCNEDFLAVPQSRPKECLQIDIPSDDPFYGPKNVKCLNLVRSIPVNGVCGGRREQLNKATSFLDGSVVYGSTIGQDKQLRTFSRGQLKTQLINNTPFMSIAEGAGYSCGTPSEPLKCFEAGDSRVNMMVELTAMHTLWYREHNRIATELHKLNPKWQDEIIYQEARRILIGELQHITYKEFLPALLGENAMENYELSINNGKIYEGYDKTVDPTVFNVFGAAAFRFGHSLVPDMQYLLGANNSTASKVHLHKTFFNAELLYHNGLDLLLRGAAMQRTHTVDSYVSPEVREHLFQPSNLDYGYDLAAVGIQRGRDHGLPSYTKWRSVCGLPDVKTWDDLYKIMDKERADMFKEVYGSVEDIDLIPAALAEHHEKGALVGPTYVCLIGRQFKKTRKGDRFWFEMQNEIGSFTKGQLDQIYKSSMARLICDNSDKIKAIQKYPFKIPSAQNPVLECDGIEKVDLSEWRSNF